MIDLKISKKVFNDKYIPYLDNDDRYLLFWGGGSSGKSYFIVQRYIYKMAKQKMNLLVVRQTGKTNRDSTFALFKQVISDWTIGSLFSITDLRIKCINGNEIIFVGLDDVEKLKSTTFESGEATDIWIEEATETQEADINQLKVRLRGGKSKKQMVLSFNPVNVNHWIKRHFIDSGLATEVHSTYKDNKFLSEDDIKALEAFKGTDEYYYNVYCLGQWGVLGKTVFDARAISNRLQVIPKPLKVGYFLYDYDGLKITNIRFANDKNGYINIYKLPNAEQITKYCLSGDTAGDGLDFYTGHVLDCRTGEQVAVLKQQFDPDEYVKQMYCLGMYYKYALIGIEANFDRFPIKELVRLGYTNQYVREKQDTYTGKLEHSFGFKTDLRTRPTIISNLIEVVREHTELINDKDTLEELLTIVRNEKGRIEAPEGGHDDQMMGLAIAYEIRSQVSLMEEPISMEHRFAFDIERQNNLGRDYGEEIKVI